MARAGHLAALALLLTACGQESPPTDAPPADAAALDQAFDDCSSGDPATGIAVLDAALTQTPGDADALVARGLCHWAAWAETEDAEAASRAYDDLTEAIDAIEAGADAQTPLDVVYSHRAFVAHALDGVWVRTLEDLDRAAALDPTEPRHALDRGVVRSYAGDTVLARAALREYLALADSAGIAASDSRRDVVEALLDDLTPVVVTEE
ncbi:hypothetical protein [Rubrivirga sp. IMCC43871]|uniref:hypothetical protein n=1 Tax=Rubrivirga sp. IMCC43871 TaxID=3391575 RepID=UPI00399007FE